MRTSRRTRDTWGSEVTVVDGLPLHARTRAPLDVRAPNVVLVHGLLVSSRYMEPTARRLWDEVPVWAPDMPGFGRSGKPPRVLDVEGLAAWLGRWLDARRLDDIVLVANSFGCPYAVDLVAKQPGRVRALILLGPTFDPAHRGALRQALRFSLNAPMERWSLGLVIARDLLDAGPRRALRTYRYALQDRIERKLPHVPVPTVVARGERDTIVPQRWAEEATALLPNARLEVIPRAAHTINYNSPDETATLIRSVLHSL